MRRRGAGAQFDVPLQHDLPEEPPNGHRFITGSRAVALLFGRQHKNVLRTIDRMLTSPQPEIVWYGRRDFQPVSVVDSVERRKPVYRMSAKDLTELAMGFTGDQSPAIRLRFLNAFEEIAERLACAEKTIHAQLHDLERREAPYPRPPRRWRAQ